MPKRRDRTGLFILSMSLFYLLAIIFLFTEDLLWQIIPSDTFVVWLSFVIALAGASGGVVLTYSVLSYAQRKHARDLVTSLMTLDVIIIVFLYFFSHPVFEDLGLFFSRERNRTLVTALGFVLTPGVLIGSFAGDREFSTREIYTSIIVWLIIAPILFSWLFISPEPVFVTTTEEGGLLGLTPIAWIYTIVMGFSAIGSLVRYGLEWSRKRDRVHLGWTLAMIFWLFSFFVYQVLTDPLQVAELVWVGGLFCGFSIVAVTMAMTSIIEPHKDLESLVEERTIQLKESREESEFYLRLWTHKMGNLLQSLISYLQLIEERIAIGESVSDIQTSAIEIGREAILVNRQVAKLYEIKEGSESSNWPVAIKEFINRAIENVKDLLPDKAMKFTLSEIPSDLMVYADGLMDVIFVNLFIRCRLHATEEYRPIEIHVLTSGETVRVSIQSIGKPLSPDIMKSFENTGTLLKSTLDLDLIMVRMLIEKYGGGIHYGRLTDPDRNLFTILFKKG